MRSTFFMVKLSCVAVFVASSMTIAAAQDCDELWIERNSYYKEAGYCFKTARAIRFFGNAGCIYDRQGDVPLSARVRRRIAQIIRLERDLGCR